MAWVTNTEGLRATSGFNTTSMLHEMYVSSAILDPRIGNIFYTYVAFWGFDSFLSKYNFIELVTFKLCSSFS